MEVQKYKNTGKKKWYLFFGLTDETYSLLCDGSSPEGEDEQVYWFLVTLFDQIYWVLGSAIGAILGSLITFSTAGIEFSMTALFVTVFVEQWLTTKKHLPAILGVAATAVCRVVFGSDIFLIPSMVVILAALSFMRKKMEAPEETIEKRQTVILKEDEGANDAVLKNSEEAKEEALKEEKNWSFEVLKEKEKPEKTEVMAHE